MPYRVIALRQSQLGGLEPSTIAGAAPAQRQVAYLEGALASRLTGTGAANSRATAEGDTGLLK